MTPERKTILWCIIALVLLLASGWSLNVALYNLWAADFHSEYSHAYASRGTVFFFVALVLFGTFASMLVAIFRLVKKRQLAKP
jgi:uncharacterized membrane protein YdfJ with MMPL/SSD domain